MTDRKHGSWITATAGRSTSNLSVLTRLSNPLTQVKAYRMNARSALRQVQSGMGHTAALPETLSAIEARLSQRRSALTTAAFGLGSGRAAVRAPDMNDRLRGHLA